MVKQSDFLGRKRVVVWFFWSVPKFQKTDKEKKEEQGEKSKMQISKKRAISPTQPVARVSNPTNKKRIVPSVGSF